MSNNGKHPINAQSDLGHALLKEGKVSNKIGFGLTKREYFAAMNMAALLSATNGSQIEHSAKQAVIGADELLKALEE